MKVFVAIFAFLAVAANAAQEEYCYKDAVLACASSNKKGPTTTNCSARYGAIDHVLANLQSYANNHILKSFEYLLIATHFGNYETNREGFQKVFRSLSDTAWDDAFDLIKYIGKRGGKMEFEVPIERQLVSVQPEEKGDIYEMYEMESLAKALDMQKQLAVQAFDIHKEATHNRKDHHDPEISAYIEEHFVHRHASVIRKLAGYITDLRGFFSGKDGSLALYLYDDYFKE